VDFNIHFCQERLIDDWSYFSARHWESISPRHLKKPLNHLVVAISVLVFTRDSNPIDWI